MDIVFTFSIDLLKFLTIEQQPIGIALIIFSLSMYEFSKYQPQYSDE